MFKTETVDKNQEISGLRREKLSILLRCKDAMIENMRLSDAHMHQKAEIDRLKVIIEFLMKRLTRCRCHDR